MNVISNVIVFSDTHLHINVMKVPFRTALVLAPFTVSNVLKYWMVHSIVQIDTPL